MKSKDSLLYFLLRFLQKSNATSSISSKSLITPALSPSVMRHEKPKQKRLIWRATQKELRQWDEDLGRINKEEALLKKTLRELNMKYQKIIGTRYEKTKTVSYEEDRKQKELERSLVYYDNLLKGLKKKNKNKIS